MEALANYSSIMLLEKRKGRKALEAVLDEYRADICLRSCRGKHGRIRRPHSLGHTPIFIPRSPTRGEPSCTKKARGSFICFA